MTKRWLDNPVSPRRYVYHVTLKKKRDSILQNGLLAKSCRESGWGFREAADQYPAMVFANNTEIVSDFFYFDDYWESFNSDYWDIWRIDTEIYKGEWYADLNTCWPGVHVCTTQSIPIEALTLMRIVDGTCSVCGCIDYGQTVSKVLGHEGTSVPLKSERVFPCCYYDVAAQEATQIYLQIEGFVERHGRYRLR